MSSYKEEKITGRRDIDVIFYVCCESIYLRYIITLDERKVVISRFRISKDLCHLDIISSITIIKMFDSPYAR